MKKISFILSLLMVFFMASNSNAQTVQKEQNVPKRCLAKGSLILLEGDKAKAVEALETGDVIKTYNPISQQYVLRTVKNLHQIASLKTFHVILENRASIQLTADHPILSLSGWKSMRPSETKKYGYTEAKAYDVGDELLHYEKGEITPLKVIKIIPELEYYDTYIVELDGDEVLIANGFLVGQE